MMGASQLADGQKYLPKKKTKKRQYFGAQEVFNLIWNYIFNFN
jgi:hypothetical protein